jgi:hypothetical protein
VLHPPVESAVNLRRSGGYRSLTAARGHLRSLLAPKWLPLSGHSLRTVNWMDAGSEIVVSSYEEELYHRVDEFVRAEAFWQEKTSWARRRTYAASGPRLNS